MTYKERIDEVLLDGASVDEFEEYLDEAWQEFLATPEGAKYKGEAPPIEKGDEGDGDAIAVTLFVIFASAFAKKFGEKAAESLWEDILRPAIRRKSQNSIRSKKDDNAE